jgi:NAD(P)-dependent dehydrogenase (short-subunit alcohol dehydrogenase family)
MSGSDRVALVIGGGRGIAAAAVRALAGDGYRIAALSPSGRAMELARSLGGVGTQGSNRSVADLQAVTDLALTTFGRIDVVVNSSGHAARKPVLEISDDEWAEGYEMYLLNVIRMTRIVTLPWLPQVGIVNVSTSSSSLTRTTWSQARSVRRWVPSLLYSDEYGPPESDEQCPSRPTETRAPPERSNRIPLQARQYHEACVIGFSPQREPAITGQNIRDKWRVLPAEGRKEF